jgi:hypothetical protein
MAIALVEHSTLSFSGRERWVNCPVSVVLSKGEPDNSGPAAAEGTAAHLTAEFYVRQHFSLPGAQDGEAPDQLPVMDLDRFKGKEGDALATEARVWNDELRKHGKAYCAYIQSLIPAGAQAFVSLEQKVAARTIDKRLFGTADCLIWFPDFKVLTVVDYKYGFMDVEVGTVARPNLQLAAYAVAGLDECTLQADGGVQLAIFQPRRPLGEAGQKLYLPAEWVATEREKLSNEVMRVDIEAASFESGSTPVSKLVKPGDHCRYCKAAAKCPATAQGVQAALDTNAGLRSVLDMPEDDLLALYASRTAIKNLMEDIEERVSQLAKTGSAKICVETKSGRRMWRNPKEATLTLLALGLDGCLAPGPLSEVLDQIPEQFREPLVGRARDSVSIKVVTETKPSAIAESFRKYTTGVDANATNV